MEKGILYRLTPKGYQASTQEQKQAARHDNHQALQRQVEGAEPFFAEGDIASTGCTHG